MSSTIAKSLWPDQDSIGQCEAQREGRYLNDTPETDKRCAHSVKFDVDGKRLCARHAAQAALRVLLGNSRDEFIAAAINDARYFEKQRDELETAFNQAISKVESATSCHPNAVRYLLDEAIEIWGAATARAKGGAACN